MKDETTAGPWVAEPADMFGDHNIVLDDRSEDCRAIAAVVSNMRDPVEVAANAHLIAAAPDLLEAVERARRHAENIGITDGGYIAQLDASIAKARGASHD